MTACGSTVASTTTTADDDHTSEPRPVKTADQPRAVVEGDFPLFCTMTKDTKFSTGACFLAAEPCESFRAMRHDSSPCESTTAGACYNETLTITGKREVTCYPSIEICEEMLANDRARRSPDFSNLPTQCGIYRQRKVE